MRTLLILLLLAPCLAVAQLTPQQAIDAMGRGINLGNTLEPPTEGAWNNGPARENFFDLYVDAGFTNVRIPVRWDMHTARTAPYAIDTAWMNRVEEVVDWGLDRGLYVTLNGHHEDWLKQNYASQTLRDRYDAIWVQIIERFQDKSDRLLYEIINEPVGLTVAQVDDLNARILGLIRAEEPTRLVIYGGNMYANAEQLYTAAIPDDDYVIGYFHSYDPWPFAGEAQRGWGSPADYAALTNKMAVAAAWSDQRGVPIHVSEFGAHVDNNYNDRMRYYAHYVDLVQLYGFAWSVWDDGGWFQVMERPQNRWPELKDVLIHVHNDSPVSFFLTSEEDGIRLDWTNRSTSLGEIHVQRLSGRTFEDIAVVASDAETFLDESAEVGSTYTYRVITERGDGTPVHGYPQRHILRSAVQTAFGDDPQTIPGVVLARDYDQGGQDVAYNDQEERNIPGGYRPAEGVDLEDNGRGSFHLAYVNSGEWVEYTVNVEQAGIYTVSADVASDVSGGAFTITFAGDEEVSLTNIPRTGGWLVHQAMDLSGQLNLAAGEQTFRLSITGANAFNVDELTFTLQSTSTEEASIAAGFGVAPNPVSDEVTLTLPTEGWMDSSLWVDVIDLRGRRLRQHFVSGSTATLPVADLPRGVYVLRLTDGRRTLVRRVTKQ